MDHRQYILNHLEEIDELLHFKYGSPDHNNKKDPLDELIFILLSRRTRSAGYENAYDSLKEKFPDWKSVAMAKPGKILRIIGSAGLGNKRVEEIQQNLQSIERKFGECSLDRLRKWGGPKVLEYLRSLKGIEYKSAYCIMMYSLGRKVFPVDTHVNRIFQRLGLIEMGVDHKKGQEMLANVIPESLRYRLHVNMVVHGREICLAIRPRCDDCVISGFCEWVRDPRKAKRGPKIADLFAGAGGMSLGFERAGFRLDVAIESNKHACATFLYNRKHLTADRIIERNIKRVKPREIKKHAVQVVIAGPPCQEFSKVRKNSNGETGKNELYKEVIRYVKIIRPVFVIIENVPGMASHLNSKYAKRVERKLRKIGYAVSSRMINARDYGVPQNRKRLFFIARRVYRNSIQAAEDALSRVWNDIEAQRKSERVNFWQGVSGLPRLKAGEGADILEKGTQRRHSNYAYRIGCDNGGIIFNHIARKHNPLDLEIFKNMKEGENIRDLYARDPHMVRYSIDNFPTKYYRIIGDSQSPTIVAHLRRDANSFIHPSDNRGITPREAARLQSFPDNYRFLGTFGIQFEQIGNAVPPLLAGVIGNAIMKELDISRRRKSHA